jgi:hypothetical protein
MDPQDTREYLKERADNDLYERALAGAERAYFAYHAPPSRDGAHNFYHHARNAKCMWCRKQRFEVRHGEGPVRCQERPDDFPYDIEEVIREEEEEYLSLIEGASEEIENLVDDPESMSGEEIAILHHTHGYPPSIVEGAMEIEFSEDQMQGYQEAMDDHRSNS